jgi:hypothetical protein
VKALRLPQLQQGDGGGNGEGGTWPGACLVGRGAPAVCVNGEPSSCALV